MRAVLPFPRRCAVSNLGTVFVRERHRTDGPIASVFLIRALRCFGSARWTTAVGRSSHPTWNPKNTDGERGAEPMMSDVQQYARQRHQLLHCLTFGHMIGPLRGKRVGGGTGQGYDHVIATEGAHLPRRRLPMHGAPTPFCHTAARSSVMSFNAQSSMGSVAFQQPYVDVGDHVRRWNSRLAIRRIASLIWKLSNWQESRHALGSRRGWHQCK